jgi:hypothetical protein
MISNYLFAKQVYYVCTICVLLLAHPTIYAATATLKFSNDRDGDFHEVAIPERCYVKKERTQSDHLAIDNRSSFSVQNKTVKNLTLNRTGAKLQNLVYAPIDTNIYLLLIGVIIYGYVLLRNEKRIKFK